MPEPSMDYLYNGKEFNEDIGWYDYGARWYDPSIGRWNAVDLMADHPNQVDKSPYAYAWNDPVSLTDPDGNCPWCPAAVAWAERKAIWEGGKALYRAFTKVHEPPPGWVPPIRGSLESTISPIDATRTISPEAFSPEDVIVRTEDESDEGNIVSEIDWENNPPATPDDLGDDWEDVTHPEKAKNTENRDFKNKKTGEKITFDKGKEGETGFEGKDHWHRHNPNSTGNGDKYLDQKGSTVPKGSRQSHIDPNKKTN